jgi:hypothetical protein
VIENGNPAAKLETILAVLSALGLEFQIAQRQSTFDILKQLAELAEGDAK